VISLEELKAHCLALTPELFNPFCKAELLAMVEDHLFKASYEALLARHAGWQYHVEAHSHLAKLFRQWRNELKEH
jgi:hypothetical protein